jgi:L-alanine-DL-glutamate epimerase-like enolase superfamily enzyme
MKITEVRTYNHDEFPNLIQVEVMTDEGITGTGESYYFGNSVAAFIQEFLGPAIVGENPLNQEALAEKCTLTLVTTVLELRHVVD